MAKGDIEISIDANASGAIKGFKQVEAAAKGAAAGIDKSSQNAATSMEKFGTKTARVGKKMTVGLTLPLVGIGVAAVNAQASFEQSINLLGVNAGVGGAALAKMADQAKQLGADTVFSASEAADAMLELAKAGFKPAEISGGGVQATMALAATEGLNLADAATIAGNAMNTFGIKAKDAGVIADALAGGSAASSASVESLSQALSQVGPGAKNAGLTLQDTVGVLAAFDQAGIKGSDAGTSLKTMLTRLVPQTTKASKEMARLGLFSKDTGSAFVDAHGNFKDISDIAGILQKKLGGLSEAQKTTALNTIFGSDATRAASVLLADGKKGIDKYIDAATKQGTAQKLADARMKGTAGALEQMKGSIDSASIALGEALAPTVIIVSKKIQGLANWFSHLDSGTQHTVATIGALVAALGPVLFVTGKVISSVNGTIKAIDKFSTSMSTAEGRSAKMSTAARGLAGAGGMIALTDGVRRGSTALGALETTAGAAAVGFAVGGPLGAGIGAAAGGLFELSKWAFASGKAAKSTLPDWKNYTTTLSGVTAATTAATRAMVLESLQKTGLLKQTQALNISDRDAVQAAMGNEAARKRVTAALAAATAEGKNYQALNVAQRLGTETSAVYASRVAQLKKNLALAATKEEAQRIQEKLDKLARTNANPHISIGGADVAIQKLNAVLQLMQDVTHAKGGNAQLPKGGSLLGQLDGAGATGAIVRRPTIALIGEAGPEALIPLNRTAGNSPLPAGLGGRGITIEQVTIQAAPNEPINSSLPRAIAALDLLYGAA